MGKGDRKRAEKRPVLHHTQCCVQHWRAGALRGWLVDFEAREQRAWSLRKVILVVCPVDGASGSAGWIGVEVLRHPAVMRSMHQTTGLAKGVRGTNCWAVGCSSSEDRAPFYDLDGRQKHHICRPTSALLQGRGGGGEWQNSSCEEGDMNHTF